MSGNTWDLIKLAFRYFARGFERIIFMILGAEIAFLICYLFFCDALYGIYLPMLPAGYGTGAETLAGAMMIAGVTAIVNTIHVLLTLAAFAMIVGYIRHYLAVLSYYDEEKYAKYKPFRSSSLPSWLMGFDLFKEHEQIRLANIEDCKVRIKLIKSR